MGVSGLAWLLNDGGICASLVTVCVEAGFSHMHVTIVMQVIIQVIYICWLYIHVCSYIMYFHACSYIHVKLK